MMTRKSNEENYMMVKIFQKTNNLIGMTIYSDHLDKPKMTGIEHSDQYHGNQMKRTHNKLFSFLKTILEGEGRWKDITPVLGKKKKIIKNEEFDTNMKYGFIYITTNLINGKQYIGKHTVFGDDYLGSGTVFKKAIEKYGSENFVREDIAFGYSHEQLCDLEKFYIDQFKAVQDPNFYNCVPGGNEMYEEEAI
ncbi:hypothetical protein ACXEO8_06025 [Cytobacillus firmus]|uniref:GIY-YIG nuclease family protein n=1 Tax=Bacillus sp. 22-7 TaxID=2709707 RepID=UPI001953EC8B|nr:GIY-YIG nuclease family protein [Bacillus sp. 22-7]